MVVLLISSASVLVGGCALTVGLHVQCTDSGWCTGRGCACLATAARQLKHTIRAKMPYADLEKRRENVCRWKKTHRDKVLGHKMKEQSYTCQ